MHLFERATEDAGGLTNFLADLGLSSYETNLVELICAKHIANLITQCSTVEVQLFELIASGMDEIPKRALLSRGCIESSEQSSQATEFGEVVVLDRECAGQK